MSPNELQRFESRVDKVTESGCWVWLGHLGNGGYGQMRRDGRSGKQWLTHRLAYEHWHKKIPTGLVLDHLYRVRSCANPWHLRACTTRENNLAPGSLSSCKANVEKTHCLRGHLLGMRNKSGRRACAICFAAYYAEHSKTPEWRESGKMRMRKHRARKRAQL